MKIPENIIDLHVHIQPWDQIKEAPRKTIESGRTDVEAILHYQSNPEAFALHLESQGICKAGLINYVSPKLMGFDSSCNDWIAAYRDKVPDRFFAWGGVHPHFCDDLGAEMVRLLDELKIDGIKIHPPHQEIAANDVALYPVYAACEERGVPILVHTGTSIFPGARSRLGDPMDLDDVAIDFPKLKILMAHAGRPLWYEHAFFVARRHRNVYIELSGIPPKQLPQHLPRLEFLEGNVLWGTDWPSPGVRNLRANIETFCSLTEYSDEFKHAVLVENPKQITDALS
jgi:predicted TIM-barrel fold metal-dependent hydrolase